MAILKWKFLFILQLETFMPMNILLISPLNMLQLQNWMFVILIFNILNK